MSPTTTTIPCDHCDGYGIDPDDDGWTMPCPECGGEGTIDEPVDCEDGDASS